MFTNTLIYLLARGIPSLINFIAIPAYTRLLTPEDFGKYTLIIASASLLSSILFQWLNMGISRFLPGSTNERGYILSTVSYSFIVIVIITTLCGGLLYIILPDSFYRSIIPICIPLFWALGLFDIYLQVVASTLLPVKYGIISAFKAVTSLSIGIYLIQTGFTEKGPIFGIMTGILLSTAFVCKEWKGIQIAQLDKKLLKQFLKYGLPLTITFALTFIISTSDRFLLSWFLGTSTAGLYAAGYDLAQQSLGMLMIIVNLAAYPLVVQALEQNGINAAQEQLRKQISMLLTIAIPATAGLVFCSENIAEVFLGEAFRSNATIIIPWVALTTLISGIKAYYLDLSFQLGHHTKGQVRITLISALCNLVCNIALIPLLGLKGALIGSAAAYTVGFLLSLAYGRRVFTMPPPPRNVYKIFIAAGLMLLGLASVVQYRGRLALAMQLTISFTVYFGSCLLLDVMDLRKNACRLIQKARIVVHHG